MHQHSIHHVREDAYRYAWDRDAEPALEVTSHEVVAFSVRDASDEQIGPSSDPAAVVGLDCGRVNPVSGPVYVRGAEPGYVRSADILELRPRDWGWTAIIPG